MAHAPRYHAQAAVTINAIGNTGSLPNLCDFERVLPIVSAIINLPNAPTGTTPGAIFSLDVSVDGVVWVSVATTASITAAGVVRLVASNIIEPFVRISWTVSGTTPSFTGVLMTILCN